jgi:DNA repair ATPase RecN
MFDVVAGRVDGVERRKELARMASGDTVVNEAEVFAEALLRDASSIRNKSQDLKP